MIYCETKEAEEAVLTKLELLGFRWGSGHNPTKYSYFATCNCNSGVYISREHKKIYAGFECELSDKQKLNSITAQDYLFKGKYKVVDRNLINHQTKVSDENGRVEDAQHENWYIAAKLALEKFKNTDAEQLYSGKVKCVSSSTNLLTDGKIYEIKNGVFKYDNGKVAECRYSSYEEFQASHLSTFEEVTEQLYSGEVKCIKTKYSRLTEGKIYEIKNGVFTYDDGCEDGDIYKSFEAFQARHVSKFKEVKRGGEHE